MPEVVEAPSDLPVQVPGYRLVRLIATGGMGSVYEAERLTTGEHFAVKVIRASLAGDASYLARFGREVQALRSIRHPNVVDVFEWNLPGAGNPGPAYVVMELLRGHSLVELLRRVGRLSARQVVSVMLQVLDGLAAAHAVGVIHRDLGPSNVVLSLDPGGWEQVKLLDFGLARPIDDREPGAAVTQKGTLVGKPAFVAPEMFRGEPLDARADVFACGILMFQMLTGELPYRARAGELLWMERYAEREPGREYPGPRSLQPDVPEALDAVVVRAIRKRPEERYSSAREMQAALLSMQDASIFVEDETTVRIRRKGGVPVGPPLDPGTDLESLLAPAAGDEGRPPIRPNDRVAHVARSLGTEEVKAASPALDGPTVTTVSRRRSDKARLAALALTVAVLGVMLVLVIRAAIEPGGRLDRSSTDVAPRPAPSAEPPAGGRAPEDAAPVPDPDAVATSPVAGVEPDAAAEPAATWAESHPSDDFVQITFVGVPAGADVRLDGRPVASNGTDVPRSEVPLRLTVTVAGGAYAPFERDVVPSQDREIRVRMERLPRPGGRSGSRADAGALSGRDAGVVPGRFGTVFAPEFDPPP